MIRKATKADMPDIMPEVRKFVSYHPHSGEFDTKHMYQLCLDLMKDHIFLVSWDGRKLAGFITGLVTSDLLFPSRMVATELAWWVCEEYRGGLTGVRLLKAWHEEAKARGAQLSAMVSTSRTPELYKLYEKFDYEHTETTYVRKL